MSGVHVADLARGKGWVWYEEPPEEHKRTRAFIRPETAEAAPNPGYAAPIPSFDFDDILGAAPTTVRGPEHGRAPAMHQVVSMPPAIPANGPGVALPTPVPASPPTQGAESAYYHWVRAIRRARATTTFEFTGTAAHLDPARSIVVESLDIEPIAPVQESVLETSNATWFMVTFTVVFLASLAALLLSTEITVAVHRLGQLVAGLVTGPV